MTMVEIWLKAMLKSACQLGWNGLKLVRGIRFGRILTRLRRRSFSANEDGFDWKGRWFEFPAIVADMNGYERKLAETTALEFCEVTDLLRADSQRYGALIVAILCRPGGEAYCEKTAMKRAAEMGKNLPERVIQKVIGMVAEAHVYMKEMFPDCYAGLGSRLLRCGVKVESEEAGCVTWSEFLLGVARYKLSEVRVLERMNCYDFMRLADGYLRYRKRLRG